MTRKVGYGSPPIHSQWEKGQSGNPRGRPKKRPSFLDDLTAELGETIQVTENGKTRRMTKQRALFKALYQQAMKGSSSAARLITHFAAQQPAEATGGPELLPLEPSDLKLLAQYLERQSNIAENK